ncbi:MAG: AraC family transcriptional regulator [Acidobacteriota bacterium]
MRDWSPHRTSEGERVETLVLRDQVTLVLSRFAGGCEREFRFEEPEDMLGIGFHLMGGSRFEFERSRFATKPLEVWAGTAPRGATSVFTLPRHGFETVSLRFSPEAIQDLLERHGPKHSVLTRMARSAQEEVRHARLGWLDPTACQLVEAMLSSPYTGAARRLFLESCAFGLLASQINASEAPGTQTCGSQANGSRTNGAEASAPQADPRLDGKLRRKMLAARDYLDGNLQDPPTIATLARIAGTNEFYLKRAFKEAFGMTVFGYVRRRRMQFAAAELHAGRSVQETARAAGYACPRSFAEAFRRHYGVLPSVVLRRPLAETPADRG